MNQSISFRNSSNSKPTLYEMYESLRDNMQALEKKLPSLSPEELKQEVLTIENLQEMISNTWLQHSEDSTSLTQENREDCYKILVAIQETNTRLRRQALANMAALKHDRSNVTRGRRTCQSYCQASQNSYGKLVSTTS